MSCTHLLTLRRSHPLWEPAGPSGLLVAVQQLTPLVCARIPQAVEERRAMRAFPLSPISGLQRFQRFGCLIAGGHQQSLPPRGYAADRVSDQRSARPQHPHLSRAHGQRPRPLAAQHAQGERFEWLKPTHDLSRHFLYDRIRHPYRSCERLPHFRELVTYECVSHLPCDVYPKP
eukprot:794060-Prorocentrum_minimum.AAC.3